MNPDKYVFLYPDKRQISGNNPKQVFLEFYNNEYFRERFKKNVYSCHVSGLHRTSCFVEKEIISFLSPEYVLQEKDIPVMLAWKIGKIAQVKSGEEGKIIFHKDWKEQNNQIEYYYGGKRTIPYKQVFETIKEFKGSDDEAAKMLDKLISLPGIGPVYAITLLFFRSKGNFPIYDRYASIALKRIMEKDQPDYEDRIITTNAGGNLFDQYQKYITCLENLSVVLDVDFRKCRSIDRALWAYGHLFNKTDQKTCC